MLFTAEPCTIIKHDYISFSVLLFLFPRTNICLILLRLLIFLFDCKLSASYEICTRDFQRPIRCSCQFRPPKAGSSRADSLHLRRVAFCPLCTAVVLGFLFPVILRIPFPSPIWVPWCCNYCGFIDIWLPHIKSFLTVLTVYMNF